MHLDTKATIGGHPVFIIIRHHTEERLAGTCFRGKSKNLAGNFCRWENGSELFADRSVLSKFLREIQEAFWVGDYTSSICFEFDSAVGWTGTDKREGYRGEDLEEFNPNRRSRALRVKLTSLHVPVPTTRLITFVCEIKEEGEKIVVIVHSVYPGRDIGELRGYITEREHCVFFDWNHPGAPLQ